MQVVRNAREIEVSSKNSYYTVNLNEEMLIPKGYDILGTLVELLPDIVEVRLMVGGQYCTTFNDRLGNKLETMPIYMSMLPYQVVCLEFRYDSNSLYQRKRRYMGTRVKVFNRYHFPCFSTTKREC